MVWEGHGLKRGYNEKVADMFVHFHSRQLSSPEIQFIITDSLNDHKIQQSQTLAEIANDKLVTTLRKHYRIKNHGVKTAPFYVLRFTTMPSILAEVGFISNSAEEKRLRTKGFQKKLAEGIYQGVRSYLKEL